MAAISQTIFWDAFLAATKKLYEHFSPSVCLSLTPLSQCSCHRIITKFSAVITIDKSDFNTKSQSPGSKVKVTEVITQLNRFQTVTPVWIIWWLNDSKSLMLLRRGAPLFFKVIHQISRSHETKKIADLFTDGFEMMHKAWCSIEEVLYWFFRSSIKFQGHTGWKIDDLNPIWVRILGPSQLSNPSDLPCEWKVLYFD